MISTSELDGLTQCGFLREDDGVRLGAEEFPAPRAGYVVSFPSFHESGFAIPTHPFFAALLEHYQIPLHCLNPNGIQHIAAFITLFEGCLGIEPHFDL